MIEFDIISTLIQGGGTGVIGYFVWSMMREIRSVRNDMNSMTNSFNRKLYGDDGRLIYRRLDDCKDQMCEYANDINSIGMKVHKNTNDLIRLEMQVAALQEQAKKGA